MRLLLSPSFLFSLLLTVHFISACAPHPIPPLSPWPLSTPLALLLFVVCLPGCLTMRVLHCFLNRTWAIGSSSQDGHCGSCSLAHGKQALERLVETMKAYSDHSSDTAKPSSSSQQPPQQTASWLEHIPKTDLFRLVSIAHALKVAFCSHTFVVLVCLCACVLVCLCACVLVCLCACDCALLSTR